MVAAHGYWRSLSGARNAFHCDSVLAVSTWSPPETSSSASEFAARATSRVSNHPAPSIATLPDEPICGSPKNRKSKSPSKSCVVKEYVGDQLPPAPTRYEYDVCSVRLVIVAWRLKPPLV